MVAQRSIVQPMRTLSPHRRLVSTVASRSEDPRRPSEPDLGRDDSFLATLGERTEGTAQDCTIPETESEWEWCAGAPAVFGNHRLVPEMPKNAC